MKYGDAQKFVERLNDQMASSIPAGWAYVPTEAQWEYAAGRLVQSIRGVILLLPIMQTTIGMEIITLEVTINRPAMWVNLIRITGVFMICMEMYRSGFRTGIANMPTGPLTDPSRADSGSRRRWHLGQGGTWWDTGIYLRSGDRFSADLSYVNGGVGFSALEDIIMPQLI